VTHGGVVNADGNDEVKRYVTSGLNYIFKSLDLIPDGIDDLGFCDDAFVIRVAAALACEADPSAAFAVNVEGTRHLLRALEGRACHFIFVSTDSVFDGTRGDYEESDPALPLHVYGRTKLEAEHLVLSLREDGLVVRTVFYGWNVLPKASLAEWILGNLRAGKAVPGFRDRRFSPILTDHLAALLLDLAPARVAGLLHVAGSESCSKYEFARRLARAFDFPDHLVLPTDADAVPQRPPRPRDTTLSVARAAAILRRQLPDVEEGLSRFKMTHP
jgi:dTDP-4-dehydrorhamnose reductase